MGIILETKNLSRTYGTKTVKTEALKDCNISFEQGEFTAIIGKSGSGKSTLLRLLAALDTPTTGEVYIDGTLISKMKDKQLSEFRRRKIGFVYQDYNLFPEFTAYENIIMPIALDGRNPDSKWIDELMDTLGISDCRNKFSAEMSGGEQQRASIARAFAADPAVIFADEPTGNLDAENANEVAMLLSKASRLFNKTVIMVTHDRMMADFASRVITISDGRVSEN